MQGFPPWIPPDTSQVKIKVECELSICNDWNIGNPQQVFVSFSFLFLFNHTSSNPLYLSSVYRKQESKNASLERTNPGITIEKGNSPKSARLREWKVKEKQQEQVPPADMRCEESHAKRKSPRIDKGRPAIITAASRPL